MESIRKRLISGSAWAFGGKLLAAISGLVVNVLLARLLTPEDFGIYFLIFSLVSVAVVVAQLGMNHVAVRLIAESIGTGSPERAIRAIRQILTAVGIGAMSTAALMVAGAGDFIALYVFHSPEMAALTRVAALWIIVVALQGILAEIFRGFHSILLATLFSGLFTNLLLVSVLGVLWFWHYDSSLVRIIQFAVIAAGCGAVLAAIVLRTRLRRLQTIRRSPPIALWRTAWPLLVTNLTLFVLAQVDLWVIGMFRPQQEVAIYGAAARLTAMVTVPLMIINAVTPPLIAELHVQGENGKLQKILRVMATWAGVPALLVSLVFVTAGSSLMEFAYGEYFGSGGAVLALLSVGQLANVWSGSCGLTLIMTGNQNTMMIISVLSGLVAFAGAILLVDSYGILGVAAVAASAMILQNVLMLVMVRKKIGIWTHMYCLPVRTTRRAN